MAAPLRLPPPLRLLCALLLLLPLPSLRFSGAGAGAPPASGAPPALVAAAAGHNVVSHLPGFHGPLPFYLETGYVGVGDVDGDDDEVQLFYYFVASERDPAEDPLLLWLTGGPGCSGLLPLADQIDMVRGGSSRRMSHGRGSASSSHGRGSASSSHGQGSASPTGPASASPSTPASGPINVHRVPYDRTVPTLELNPYSWSKVASIIFLDSPVGAGFSFSRNPEAFNVGDTSASKHVHSFMRKWLDTHPQFISNPFYVGGESYSGIIVPTVTHLIAEGIRGGDEPLINLKGYLVGNPLTRVKEDLFSRVLFLYRMNIISDEIYESTVKHCHIQDYENPDTAECAENLGVVKKFLSEINAASTLEKRCDLSAPEIECREYNFYLIYKWANNVAVRKALHVQEGSTKEWERCSSVVTRNYTYDIESSITYHLNLTSGGYRALIYSGDHDVIIPYTGTQAWIKTLNYSIVDDWRSWNVDDQVAGYTRSYWNNLTYATVKGAGHIAPSFKPKESLTMFDRWISHNHM